MNKISRSVIKKDHLEKAEGRSVYAGDYERAKNGEPILTGMLLRSKIPRGRILSVEVPSLPEGYYYIDASDVPGRNCVHIQEDDMPVFCADTVEYVGDAIGMVAGPDPKKVEEILSEIRVRYEELEPVLDFKKAEDLLYGFEFGHGDVENAFACADRIYEEEFETGYQEQAYLEPQSMIAEPEADGKLLIHGSMQCVFYVHAAAAVALGCGPDGVHVLQDATGGGFGGKESYPSVVGTQVAVAAYKTKAPVRLVFGRREDMEVTPKRHPSFCRYKMAVKDGRVTALSCEITLNGGPYKTLSGVVLKRAMMAAPGVYNIPNVHITGRAVRTNTPLCGAFRGFGAPQAFFAVERMMGHIAQDLGVEEIMFKTRHLVKQGDLTPTSGRFHFPVPLAEMIDEIDARCDYFQKRSEYAKPQTGRYRRGIGMSLVFHGLGFTGAMESKVIKSRVKLLKSADGTVEILASNTDIGQGVRTTFPKIVAQALDIAPEKVFYDYPDTARVPDAGPTVASRSLMIVGELLRRAAEKLKESWIEGEAQEIEERYSQPDYIIDFNDEKMEGDAYPEYAWGVTVTELETDVITGNIKVLRLCGNFDLGTPADENILIGQMEGGLLQGMGFAFMEKMGPDARGIIRNNNFADYMIPTSADVPDLEVMLHVQEYPCGPFGAKGGGELPLVGVPAAYAAAAEQILGGQPPHRVNHCPFNAEDFISELGKEKMRNG